MCINDSEILKVTLLINHREHGEHREPYLIFTLCSLCFLWFIIPRLRNPRINKSRKSIDEKKRPAAAPVFFLANFSCSANKSLVAGKPSLPVQYFHKLLAGDGFLLQKKV